MAGLVPAISLWNARPFPPKRDRRDKRGDENEAWVFTRMTRLSTSFGRLFDLLTLVAALILFAMVVLVTADILLRDFTGGGFVWATEVSEYALYVITLLVAPWLLRRG